MDRPPLIDLGEERRCLVAWRDRCSNERSSSESYYLNRVRIWFADDKAPAGAEQVKNDTLSTGWGEYLCTGWFDRFASIHGDVAYEPIDEQFVEHLGWTDMPVMSWDQEERLVDDVCPTCPSRAPDLGATLVRAGPTNETDGEFLARIGTDAQLWAREFLATTAPFVKTEDLLIGWFANAIEAGAMRGAATQLIVDGQMERRALEAERLLSSMMRGGELMRDALGEAGEVFGYLHACMFGAEQHLRRNGWIPPEPVGMASDDGESF